MLLYSIKNKVKASLLNINGFIIIVLRSLQSTITLLVGKDQLQLDDVYMGPISDAKLIESSNVILMAN